MLTLTVPHDLSDPLRELLGGRRGQKGRFGLAGAIRRFRQDRITKGVTKKLSRLGWIRATEITRGAAGWHPHFHELWFATCPTDDRLRLSATSDLLRAWKRSCTNAGLDEPNRHGIDLRWAWDAAEYLTKIGHEQHWGAARELVAAGTKRGRRGSNNSWQLLENVRSGDAVSRALWAEFALATYRRTQLLWQRGLKSGFAIAEHTDQQLARFADEDSFPMAVIPADRWKALISLPFEWRPRLLEFAEDGGPDAIHDFLDLLEIDPERAREFAGIS